MGQIIDTTNIIDSSMKVKARTPKNMVIENEYLTKIQQKINYEWNYRYNHVDIEEEDIFGSEEYTPIEVVVQSVYSDTLKKVMSDDWKKLVFRNIKHPIKLGKRYRFETSYNPEIPIEQKNIWITVNYDTVNPTCAVVVRKCDSILTFVEKNTGEIHFEPVILESETKNINFWRDETIVLAQGEIIAIMQYNDYTKGIKINNRFFIGATDMRDEANNWIYKVKAVRKYQGETTYDVNSVPLITAILEKDDLGAKDDRLTRVAVNAPVYYNEDFNSNQKEDPIIPQPNNPENPDNSEEPIIKNNYHIEIIDKDSNQLTDYILLNDTQVYSCFLYNNDELITQDIEIQHDLLSTNNDVYYYDFVKIDGNTFSIHNKKMYLKDQLQITCSINDERYQDQPIVKEFLIKLGGVS